ncbi:hypothetical protein [Pacificibacter maritimus]|uniref:hypothetical protein n=1 Tax=Pacificibacter maritimus TaxID=762213 RepID=UPI00147305CA|nr:hypothetical protein [Pacificibacter maritimus]
MLLHIELLLAQVSSLPKAKACSTEKRSAQMPCIAKPKNKLTSAKYTQRFGRLAQWSE